VSAQAVHHGLIESHEKIERPDLPAVSVPGGLQVHPRRHRFHYLLGLMREKHHRQRRIGIHQRRFEIRPVSIYVGCLGGRVVNARDDELVTIASDDDVPVV
jgi:hypothetical protein